MLYIIYYFDSGSTHLLMRILLTICRRSRLQVSCAIRELVKFAGGNDAAHIICGDFNAVSTSPPYQLVRDGFIDALSKAKLQALPTVHVNDKVPKGVLRLAMADLFGPFWFI